MNFFLQMSCLICKDEFDSESRKPRILPCGHSFCEDCLETRSYLTTCAYCRTTNNLESYESCIINFGLLNGRPVNFHLSELEYSKLKDLIEISNLKKKMYLTMERFREMKNKVISRQILRGKVNAVEIDIINKKMSLFDKYYQKVDDFECGINKECSSFQERFQKISSFLDKEKSKSKVRILFF